MLIQLCNYLTKRKTSSQERNKIAEQRTHREIINVLIDRAALPIFSFLSCKMIVNCQPSFIAFLKQYIQHHQGHGLLASRRYKQTVRTAKRLCTVLTSCGLKARCALVASKRDTHGTCMWPNNAHVLSNVNNSFDKSLFHSSS